MKYVVMAVFKKSLFGWYFSHFDFKDKPKIASAWHQDLYNNQIVKLTIETLK
jgi:hypothetical protein